METSDLIAWLAIGLSAFTFLYTRVQAKYTRAQAETAKEAYSMGQQLGRANAIIHFTDRFFDLLKEGRPGTLVEKINDSDWAYQFWSLHATEFYFFHHGLLPRFMYSLWMVDMAKLYSHPDGEGIRASHVDYLNTYALNYDDMSKFFDNIYRLSKTHSNESVRNTMIRDWVYRWLDENKRSELG